MAAEMRKTKKNRKVRKKVLDTSARKRPNSGRGEARNKQLALPVFKGDDLSELTFDSPSSPFDMAPYERRKRGRPTIPDNVLLGYRNSWVNFLEEAWPEIVCNLLGIRNGPDSTVEDIQTIFEPVQSKDNCNHGKAFVRGTPEYVKAGELRKNRTRNSNLFLIIQNTQSQFVEALRSCMQCEEALKQSTQQEHAIIQTECRQRLGRLFQALHALIEAKQESMKLVETVLRQETYYYCSQLLHFLRGKKKYAIEPLTLANALAGLPEMGWRESLIRCYKMPRSFPESLTFRVWKVVSIIWRRIPNEIKEPPTEFFLIQIFKPQRGDDGTYETLRHAWRDLRFAILECWTHHDQNFMPCAITIAFMRLHLGPKSETERILGQNEYSQIVSRL
jgi:hypothetical protein